jgi:hypothetical protein
MQVAQRFKEAGREEIRSQSMGTVQRTLLPNSLRSWRWREHVPPKHWYPLTERDGVIAWYTTVWTVTTVITWNVVTARYFKHFTLKTTPNADQKLQLAWLNNCVYSPVLQQPFHKHEYKHAARMVRTSRSLLLINCQTLGCRTYTCIINTCDCVRVMSNSYNTRAKLLAHQSINKCTLIKKTMIYEHFHKVWILKVERCDVRKI